MNFIKSTLTSKGFWMTVVTTIVILEVYPMAKAKVLALLGK
jgi:hypothetical protein